MKNGFTNVSLEKNPLITIKVAEGHFATTSAHFNMYFEMSELKYASKKVRAIARELALPYLTTTVIDTIVCMEGTEVVGAYLAEELTKSGPSLINFDEDVYVITPINSVNKKLIFRDNLQEAIKGKNVLLLVTSVVGGRAVDNALECIEYYGGRVVGISALFSAGSEHTQREINSVFTGEDVPGYITYSPENCELCKSGQKLDAFVTGEGYTKI
ncbi:MAG: hypothetical protein FWE29_04585 [Defluviitaleaceae bacterium]|nr:hypothetical protein [Defluviitaleaceae bacterium]